MADGCHLLLPRALGHRICKTRKIKVRRGQRRVRHSVPLALVLLVLSSIHPCDAPWLLARKPRKQFQLVLFRKFTPVCSAKEKAAPTPRGRKTTAKAAERFGGAFSRYIIRSLTHCIQCIYRQGCAESWSSGQATPQDVGVLRVM